VSRRARLSVAAAALTLAALIVVFQWVQAGHSRNTALNHAARETELLAHMLAEYSRHSIGLTDLVLDAAPVSGRFRAVAPPPDFIRNIVVLDPEGRLLWTLRPDPPAAVLSAAARDRPCWWDAAWKPVAEPPPFLMPVRSRPAASCRPCRRSGATAWSMPWR